MATTTNFGWETPDDTDLVKDGALAMRTLGNAIDASLVDLKGGTTGQVLSKNSNTDMDFTWVTSDDANAIQNAIVDAKGDLITATAADTPSRIAVGNNGETLVADSSTSTGLRWQGSQAAGRNFVINGGMDIWQRGTSLAFTGGAINYVPDRWQAWATAAGTSVNITRQNTSDTTNLPFIQYCTRFQRVSGNSNTNPLIFQTTFESVNSIPLAGRTVTLSFYARAGSNMTASNSITAALIQGTGTDQNVNSFTGSSTVASVGATLTTTWQRFQVTGTVNAASTQLGIQVSYTPTGTASTNDFYEITGVQVEVGSIATQFSRAGGTLAGELAACQRYYYRNGGTNAYETLGSTWVSSTTNAIATIALPVPLRTIVGITSEYSTLAHQDTSNIYAVTNVVFASPSRQQIAVDVTTTGGLTVGRAGRLLTNNSTNGYIAFSAEL